LPSSYAFEIDQEAENINAVYSFTTSFDVVYSVSFIEITRIIDVFDNYPSLSNGIYLVVEPTFSPKDIIRFGPKTGLTVCRICEHYMNNTDLNSLIIYNCDENDGRQFERHIKFSRWFSGYATDIELEKIDKKILMPQRDAEKRVFYILSFLSLIFRKQHPRYKNIISEVNLAAESINKGKPGISVN
jgi:hypothetical protein